MDWLTFWGSIISAIIGGLIAGLFTFLGVKLTIRHDEEKAAREKLEKMEREKPRLEISGYKRIESLNGNESLDGDCNIIALQILDFSDENGRACFSYNKDALGEGNLVCVEYEFTNTGETEIEELIVSSNLPQSMAVFEFETRKPYIANQFLSYHAHVRKRYIKPKSTVNLRVFYVKGQIPTTTFRSPELSLWIRDINGYLWCQVLDAPSDEIEAPRLKNSSDLKEAINIRSAIECFRDPKLW